jgi:hypothetical protein
VSSATNPPGRHPLAGTAPATVLAVEDTLRPLPVEVAVWFDQHGNELGRRGGQPSEVTLTADEATSMKDSIFTHNHPDGWRYPPSDPRRAGNSFSDDDFAFAIRVDLAELRTLTPTLRFSLKRPLGGWGTTPELVRAVHSLFEQIVAADLSIAVASGSLTLEERDATHYHEVAKRMASQLGADYSRWVG